MVELHAVSNPLSLYMTINITTLKKDSKIKLAYVWWARDVDKLALDSIQVESKLVQGVVRK